MANSYEAEVLQGLEATAADEIRRRLRDVSPGTPSAGRVPFVYDGAFGQLTALRTVIAVYRVLSFNVTRPKALLGHQQFTAIVTAVRATLAATTGFETLSIDAAGSDSSVMQRIRNELATAAGLEPAADKGDLHLRIRPVRGSSGWEVLVRLTPRPLVTRAWRQHNFQGALSAAAASAMAQLSRPTERDTVLNLCCGSGTLMVERAALGPAQMLLGIDVDFSVLQFAADHLRRAAVSDAALVCGDVKALPFGADSFDVLLADLPFGQLVGSHDSNVKLYPPLMHEAARVARPSARFLLITHEKRLIERLLREQVAWQQKRVFPINLNGLHPAIYLLERTRESTR